VRVSVMFAVMTLGCGPGMTRTSHRASSRVHVYSDARITAISPAVRDEATHGRTVVTTSYAADVVSGATQVVTVDAISRATPFADRRHQLGLGVTRSLTPERAVSAAYGYSVERDHETHAPSLGYSQELFDRAVRATARYQLVFEDVGRSDDPLYSQRTRSHRLDLGWSQILGKSLVLAVLATATASTCDAVLGCFANPYRYVGVARGVDLIALSERHPDARATFAGGARLSWALSRAHALHGGYRLAQDSWAVTAHTADAALVSELFGSHLLVRAETRATFQDAASFYESRYGGGPLSAPAYRTADAELSPLRNVRAVLQLEWRIDPFRLVLQLGRMWNRYPAFRSLPARDAWIAGLGVDVEL